MSKELGSFLKSGRTDQGYTLREVEEKTGISNAYLSQLENGSINKPSPEVLFKLSELYEISYERLMKTAGHPLPMKNESMQGSSFRQGNNAFDDLSPEEEEKLREYLQFLRSNEVAER